MKDESIKRMSLEEATRRKGKGQTDWERLRREQEAGLEPEIDPDEGEFDWSRARVVMPPSKQAISVRIDRDVLEFFKSQGRGYQTRINAVLRSYMEAKQGGKA
ncbi:MAG: BrnA antitoxin family protein [Candidatus Tectomicrobia bacterium]|nr:BrnA antitoxin family protein [Candidatus Tectomicrobia bacterium]